METEAVCVEIRFTRATLAMLLGLLALGTVLAFLWTTGIAVASPGRHDESQPQSVSEVAGAISYQGRLEGVAGPVEVTFRLWQTGVGSEPDDLPWEESKTITPVQGLFSTVLGDTTPLDTSLFRGEKAWLGVEVEGDGEMMPRQEIFPVPYALSLRPGAKVVGFRSDGAILDIQNKAPRGESEGIRVIAQSLDGYAGYFANDPGAALQAAGSGIIRSTAKSYLWFPGTLAEARIGTDDLALRYHGDGLVRLVAATAENKRIVIPLSMPALLYGQPLRLTEVQSNVRCDGASDSTFSAIDVYRANDLGDSRKLLSVSISDFECVDDRWYSLPFPVTSDNVLLSTDGILAVDLQTYMQAGGDGALYVSRVRTQSIFRSRCAATELHP